jgi:hypothetical protein
MRQCELTGYAIPGKVLSDLDNVIQMDILVQEGDEVKATDCNTTEHHQRLSSYSFSNLHQKDF